MDRILYIAAKARRPDYVKTRLGNAIGHPEAIIVYRAFLRDLAVRFAWTLFPVGWYVTPLDAWTDLAPLIGSASHVLRKATTTGALVSVPCSLPNHHTSPWKRSPVRLASYPA
jgi:hypothetical protein